MKGLRERDRKTLPVLSTHKKKNQERDNFDVSKLHIAVLSAFSVYIPLSLNLHYTAFRSIQNNKNIINSQFNHGPAAHQIYNSIENASVLIINLCF